MTFISVFTSGILHPRRETVAEEVWCCRQDAVKDSESNLDTTFNEQRKRTRRWAGQLNSETIPQKGAVLRGRPCRCQSESAPYPVLQESQRIRDFLFADSPAQFLPTARAGPDQSLELSPGIHKRGRDPHSWTVTYYLQECKQQQAGLDVGWQGTETLCYGLWASQAGFSSLCQRSVLLPL